MGKISRLLHAYKKHISLPWRDHIAPPQRVIFCVYHEKEELKLRAKIEEFEIATKNAGHEWALFDLKDTFEEWLTNQRYAVNYYKKPQLLSMLMPKYLSYITSEFEKFIAENSVKEGHVVAIVGVASLYGFLKVKEVVDKLAPLVPGRLVVFFPGSFEGNNYRLLDAYDGWNYLAVPITRETE